MNWRMKTCIIILFLAVSSRLGAQTVAEISLLEDKSLHSVQAHPSYKKGDNSNELQQITSALFILYKKFISSQDVASCVFYPSCSEYAVEAIRTQGIVIGTMNAFDRLSRCNGLSADQYEIHPGTNLFYDPVKKDEK
jgi:putative membrane protein insertion efficiency factor